MVDNSLNVGNYNDDDDVSWEEQATNDDSGLR